jgi:hypothetical protein
VLGAPVINPGVDIGQRPCRKKHREQYQNDEPASNHASIVHPQSRQINPPEVGNALKPFPTTFYSESLLSKITQLSKVLIDFIVLFDIKDYL